MQLVRYFLLVTMLCFASNPIHAASVAQKKLVKENVQVFLNSLVVEKSIEKRGDEIYISVTNYSNLKKPSIHRIPGFPEHWLSKNAANLKDVEIFNYDLEPGEAIQIVISLMEQDFEPWNVDNLIGNIKLQMTLNDKGKLEWNWMVPHFRDQKTENTSIEKKSTKKTEKVSMFGSNGSYNITLSIKSKAIKE